MELSSLGLFHSAHRRAHDEGEAEAEAESPLEAAQYRKLHHIIRKADIRPGHRVRILRFAHWSDAADTYHLPRAWHEQVLEIGSGWGSMSLLITSTIPGTTVDTLTLSTQQAELARQRAADAGLSDRIRVHLMDYRDMPAEWEGAFDRLISVEMVEAVGKEYMEVRLPHES